METLLRLLPALVCPIVMGLAFWLMLRGQRDASTSETRQVAVTSTAPPQPAPARQNSVLSMLTMCLNPKVIAGLTVVGVGVLVFAPNLAASALPVLVVLACPLSMLFMMRAMRGQTNNSTSAACEHCAPQQEQAGQPVVIDQIPSHKSNKLLANGEAIELTQVSQEREGALVANSSWDE